MNVASPEWVVVGKFGRPQGIQGFVRVISFTEPREQILAYPHWSIKNQRAEWQQVARTTEQSTAQHLLVKIDQYATREAVAALTNLEIAVPKTALPQLSPGEYYWHELVGMQVIQDTGERLGVVDSILETGANDVLVVVDERDEHKKRVLIPYLLDSVIQAVDKNTQEIRVCWDLDF